MSTARERYRALFDRGSSTDRIEFFSDAVFAIAMTLLVLEIAVPEVPAADVGAALVDLLPEFFAYVLSFAIIGFNWITHRRKFAVITGFDSRLIQLNLVLLLLVAFAPFPTALLSESDPSTPAVALYAATVGGMSLAQYGLWAHARRAGLLAPSVDDGIYRLVRRSLLVTVVAFAISIVIALIDPVIAMLSWILLWPASIIAGRVRVRE